MLTVLAQKIRKYRHWRRLARRQAPPPPDLYYFAFGANVRPERFRDNRMNFAVLGKARAPDHRLEFSLGTFLVGMGYASIVPTAGAEVWGVLFKLDSESLALLDVLEWVNYGYYDRVLIDVEVEVEGRLETVKAYAYQSKTRRLDLTPSTEYLQGILKTGEHLGYPESYLAGLRAQAHQPFASFPVNHAFRVSNLGKERPFPGALRRVYKLHDHLRHQLMTRLP